VKTQTFSNEKRDLLELLLKDKGVVTAPVNGVSFQGVQIDGKDAFPLSFSQQRLWFLDQLEPGSAFYNFPLAVPFKATVNTVVLERAISEMVRRHESLRTVFTAVAGEPMQVVLPSLALPLTIVDLHHLSREVQDAEMIRLGAEMAQRPFDLAGGPLLRTALLRRGLDDYVFLLVMHHIISDGSSLGIFWRELVTLYNAFYLGRPCPLPDLQIQYADFAVWQRERLQGDKLAELISYWKQQLSGMTPLQLPTDRPRPPVMSYRGAYQEIVLPGPLTRALRAFSQREGATLFMTLFAAFTVLLHRYTGQDDIVVGSYVAGRDRTELEGLIGFFINTLVLRADLAGDPTFRTLLGRVREMALNAYAHQELPFEKLVEELQPERDLGRNPLFQVSFQLFSTEVDRGSPRPADGAQTIELKRGMAIFDIAVNIWDRPDQLSGHVEYSTDLFDAATMARLVGHLRTLLKSIVATPDAKLSELQILSEAEQRQLLVDWNETAAATPNRCLHQLFEDQAQRSPGAVAISAGDREISYDELNRRANRLAHRLAEQLDGKDALVAICVERGIDMMVGILAVLKARAAYVPLDPSYPPQRLAFMLQDSGARILLAEQRTACRLPSRAATTLLLDDESVYAGRPDTNPATAATPDDLCYVVYTSGSTGTPKGVASPHRATVNRLQWMWREYPFKPGEVVCQKTALSFVDSVWEMFGGLLHGVKTVVMSEDVVRDPRKLVDALAAAQVSRIVLVPSLLRALQTSGIDLAEELPALKYWTLSGEALPYALYAELRQNVPAATVLNLYGSSEVAADVLCCDLGATELTNHAVPIGRPIANTKVFILDRNRNPVPIGVPGELYVGGQGLAHGYHNRPDLTAERFVAHGFDGAERLYKTGDLVRYRSDGQIEYLGRLDHQVKVRGYRVELGEIEAVLAEHPRAGEVVAAVLQDQNDPRLLAYVVPAQDDRASLAAGSTQELTSRWQMVWNETYQNSTDGADGTFNIVGWNSSYTSEPIPPAEMRQWVDQTVERALSFKPRRVLEIGCGTGLLLLRIAPFCLDYAATDFSQVALDKVRSELQNRPGKYQSVRLYQRDARDFDGLGDLFDLVILNSVIQYFPSVEYLSGVLKAAIRLTAPTGALLIGDVRSLPLLRALHTSVELHHAPDAMSADVLRARIQRRMAEESELVADPAMFHDLAAEIGQVTVDLKRGTLVNELTQFRYDVTLRREGAVKAAAPEQWLDWKGLSIDRLENTLATERPDLIGITRIPNARTRVAVRAIECLETESLRTVAELRRRIRESAAGSLDPEALWRLGARTGYDVAIGLLGSGADGCYDAIFRRTDAPSTPAFFGFPSAGGPADSGAPDRTTHPAISLATQSLAAEFRAHLQKRLPEHMVPASIVVLEALPRTPNGKVDRRALPAPDPLRGRVAVPAQAPRTQTERRLVAIWAEILNMERVSIADNFFELGGHSLLATQLISRIRSEFNNELPVRAIFEAPTIAALAAKLDKAARQSTPRPETIGRVSRDSARARSAAPGAPS
jgi:amino acid adenylation domain-containing protein